MGVLQSKQSHVRQNLLCLMNHLTYSKHITRQLVTCDCVFLESLCACLDVVSVLVPPWWLRGREMTATIRISSPLIPSGLFGMWLRDREPYKQAINRTVNKGHSTVNTVHVILYTLAQTLFVFGQVQQYPFVAMLAPPDYIYCVVQCAGIRIDNTYEMIHLTQLYRIQRNIYIDWLLEFYPSG